MGEENKDQPIDKAGGSPLRSQLKVAVQKTNKLLGNLQEKSSSIRQPLKQGYQKLSDYSKQGTELAVEAYERRHQYGPTAIGVVAATSGAATTLRRKSMIRGAFAAVLAGGITYGLIYGLDQVDWNNLTSREKERDD